MNRYDTELEGYFRNGMEWDEIFRVSLGTGWKGIQFSKTSYRLERNGIDFGDT